MGIREDDAEGLGDLVDVGAAAHIKKIGRLAAVVLHEIHRAHGEAGPVDQAADRAVELHIGEAGGGGPRLGRLFLRLVAKRGQIFVAKQRVVVERHLGIEGDERAVFREHQRIDLEQRRVE